MPRATAGRALDSYIEAQVHGDIDLSRDAEALVTQCRGTRSRGGFRRTGAGGLGGVGSQDEVLQYVKQLWHVIARYGGELGDV
ncbi:DUF3626 domain-containing protein [Streptomyces flavidovirens]|uniref:DUF3626 domain-containing protein n=1 Tax=Streptomyces flavidovirens TaxID=67298 RepID=UPI000997A8F3|nr:DUF3626 domain-containing protein [Streptomyces flavidovirens]